MTKPIITVSYSELDTFRQCPFKHHLAYMERWSRHDPTGMGALNKGTLWHLVLEAHYNTLRVSLNQEACKASVNNVLWDAAENGTPDELIQLIEWMYEGYVSHWWQRDQDWQVLAVEHTALIPLYTLEGRRTHFRVKIKIDLVVEWPKGSRRVWIVDHKSHGDLPYQKDLDFEDQFGLYQQGLHRLGKNISGLIYNAARTKRNKGDIYQPGDPEWKTTMKPQTLEERHMRHMMYRPEPELLMIEQDALATCQTMYGKANRRERHVNGDTCNWRCDFTEACLLGRRTGNNARTLEMLQETGFRQDFIRH